MTKAAAHIDEWLKELGPSTELRKWFNHDPRRWEEFRSKYHAELRAAGGDMAVFAHGHILRVLTVRWLEMEPAAGSRLKLSAGGVGVLGYERDTAALEQWNWTP